MKNLFLAILLPISFMACKKQDECTTRRNEKLPVERTSHLVVQSIGGNSTIDMGFRVGKGFPNYSYIVPNEDYYTEQTAEGLFSIGDNFVVKDLHPLMDTKPEGKAIWYILYTYDDLKELDTIKAEDIEGVSVYAKKGNVLYHKIYKRNGDKLVNLTYFNARVDGVVSNHLTTFGKYFFYRQDRHLNMIKFVTFDHFSYSEETDSLNDKMEIFLKNPEIAGIDFNRNLSKTLSSGHSYCDNTNDCFPSTRKHCYGRRSHSLGHCVSGTGGPCFIRVTTPEYEGFGYNAANNNNTLHNLEDFFVQSAKGNQYFDNYYYVSSKISPNSITPGFISQTYPILVNDVLPIISSFLSNPNSTAILYDTTKRNRILGVVDLVDSFSNDANFQVIMTSLRSDINLYSGKSHAYIYADFQ